MGTGLVSCILTFLSYYTAGVAVAVAVVEAV